MMESRSLRDPGIRAPIHVPTASYFALPEGYGPITQ
jgi:hypothetical protein